MKNWQCNGCAAESYVALSYGININNLGFIICISEFRKIIIFRIYSQVSVEKYFSEIHIACLKIETT